MQVERHLLAHIMREKKGNIQAEKCAIINFFLHKMTILVYF